MYVAQTMNVVQFAALLQKNLYINICLWLWGSCYLSRQIRFLWDTLGSLVNVSFPWTYTTDLEDNYRHHRILHTYKDLKDISTFKLYASA